MPVISVKGLGEKDKVSLPNKIVITGTSGCGKTTLGHKLAALIGKKCIDLDDLYWLPNWTPRPDEEFLNLIQQEMSADGWIICGNYSRARQQIWEQADMVIWPDLPLFTCLWRALKRSFRRWIKQEPCCNGNHETLRRIFGRDSILLWIWSTYPRRKCAYAKLFSNHCHRHRLIRLRNDKEVYDFMEKLSSHSNLEPEQDGKSI